MGRIDEAIDTDLGSRGVHPPAARLFFGATAPLIATRWSGGRVAPRGPRESGSTATLRRPSEPSGGPARWMHRTHEGPCGCSSPTTRRRRWTGWAFKNSRAATQQKNHEEYRHRDAKQPREDVADRPGIVTDAGSHLRLEPCPHKGSCAFWPAHSGCKTILQGPYHLVSARCSSMDKNVSARVCIPRPAVDAPPRAHRPRWRSGHSGRGVSSSRIRPTRSGGSISCRAGMPNARGCGVRPDTASVGRSALA